MLIDRSFSRKDKLASNSTNTGMGGALACSWGEYHHQLLQR